MTKLAQMENTPLVRLDFSDEDAWVAVLARVRQLSHDGFTANVQIVEDAALAVRDASDLAAEARTNSALSLCVFADRTTMAGRDHALLCIDLHSLSSLRVVPEALWSIENNVSIGNMDFTEFVGAAGADGIFRGFASPF